MGEPANPPPPDPVTATPSAPCVARRAGRWAGRRVVGRALPGIRMLAAVLVLLFAALTGQVLAGGALVGVDHAVTDAALGAAATPVGAPLTQAAHVMANLANWQVAGGVLFLTGGFVSLRLREARPLLVAAIASIAGLGAVVPLKALIGRAGPFPSPLPQPASIETGFFPSGHTVTALVCFGCAALLLRRVTTRRSGRWLFLAALALSVAIAAALVWCRYHWLTDVLAGAALGGLLLCALSPLTRGPGRASSTA